MGTPSYSLKKLEALYMEARTQAITDAGSSIDEFERWLETGDEQILADIEEYNRIDCESTKLLRDWLEERRFEYATEFGERPPRPVPPDEEVGEPFAEDIQENEVLQRLLVGNAGSEPERTSTDRGGSSSCSPISSTGIGGRPSRPGGSTSTASTSATKATSTRTPSRSPVSPTSVSPAARRGRRSTATASTQARSSSSPPATPVWTRPRSVEGTRVTRRSPVREHSSASIPTVGSSS